MDALDVVCRRCAERAHKPGVEAGRVLGELGDDALLLPRAARSLCLLDPAQLDHETMTRAPKISARPGVDSGGCLAESLWPSPAKSVPTSLGGRSSSTRRS